MLRPVPIWFLPKLCQAFSPLEWKPGRQIISWNLYLLLTIQHLIVSFICSRSSLEPCQSNLRLNQSFCFPNETLPKVWLVLSNVPFSQINSSLSPPITLWNWNCRFASWCKMASQVLVIDLYQINVYCLKREVPWDFTSMIFTPQKLQFENKCTGENSYITYTLSKICFKLHITQPEGLVPQKFSYYLLYKER